MRRILASIGVLILMAATGVLGYELGTHKVKVTTTDSSAQTKSDQATTKPPTTTPKPFNLQSVLTNLKTQYPTVQDTYIYTQERDPNSNLGKPGYYTSGAEFYDTRTNTQPDGTAFGADSGGAIEVYASSSDAAKRIDYLKQFQGNPALDPGAFKQVGKVVVRASSKYNASDQSQMISYLATQVQAQ